MKKRRSKAVLKSTLTKIDPNSLKFRPLGVSQHATGSRGRVTTIIKPVLPSLGLAPPPELAVFNPDPLSFAGEHAGDECSDDDDDDDYNDDDVARGYYASSVCIIFYSWRSGI